MKFINKIILVVIILMVGIILFEISKPKDNIKLESVNLKSDKDNSMFAIMLEQDDGTYKEDISNTWPTSGYAYNESMSGCIDGNGNEIENSLSYNTDTKNVSIRTKEASYCYLYFSKPADNLYKLCKNYNNIDECIKTEINNIELVNGIWNSTLEDDGYRYVGTNPNNYICFGTTDKTTCTNNMDLYMYRIIGIFEDDSGNEHLKLIKKGTLDKSYAWHSDSSADIDWDESDLYKGLNGDYFLSSSTYTYMQDNIWINKIVEWNYTATNTLMLENYSTNGIYGPSYQHTITKSIYLHELNRNGKTSAICVYNLKTTSDCKIGEWKTATDKIGLIYASDYMLSLGNNALEYTGYSNESILSTGWMHISNNDSDPSEYSEWTMSRNGLAFGFASSVVVNLSGSVVGSLSSHSEFARPVFYLTSDIKITGGTGTIENPYIIG